MAIPTVERYQQLFESYRKGLPFSGSPEGLYAPVNYILELGGKRLRPAMAMLGYGLYRSDVERALPLAYAVEIFHNFTLVHDDIMDAASLRRGKPTVHTLFGENTAILSGDVMLIFAYEYLLQAEHLHLPAILATFNQVAREVCEGQQMDMEFEQRPRVSIPEYLRMIELKTAALLAGSLSIGAIAAEAPAEDIQRLDRFGRQSGTAFQLQDDILDTFGEGAKVGKKIGGDIAQNKKTFLWLKALELASPAQRERLHALELARPADQQEKIEEVTALYQQLGVLEHALAEKQRLLELAFADLEALHCPEAHKEPLRILADVLTNREH